MRSKTVKRLAILIAVIGLIGGTGFVAQRVQIKRLAQSVVEQADQAKKAGDLEKAELLLKGHLQNVPDDLDVQFKYANLVLERAKTSSRIAEAIAIYRGILVREAGNKDVRRRLMQLEFEGGQFQRAQEDLQILLEDPQVPDPLENTDGDLQFQMGQCYEKAGSDANAVKYYRAAIKHNASKRHEIYQRLANVLRNRLSQPNDADTVIKEMVDSDAKNYQVYLERGRYRRSSGIAGARDDFQKALDLSSGEDKKDQVEIWLEIAKLAEKDQGADAARKILERELKTAPDSPVLNEALILLELRTNHISRAIEILQLGLKTSPNLVGYRWLLARIFAERGDNQGLAVQIEGLKRVGFPPPLLRFLTAYYNINKNEYATARQLLEPLQSELAGDPKLKAQIKVLLAQCYSQLNDPERQREAYIDVLRDNPADVPARLGWIEILIKQGETDRAIEEYEKLVDNLDRSLKEARAKDRAIEEYEKLVDKVTQVRRRLARLLIARNRRRPADNRDWSKVDRLIADAAAERPESPEPTILQAESLLARGRIAEAGDVLEKARSKYPKSPEIWIAQISLMRSQGQVEKAQKLLDQAEGQLGDRVDLRLARAQLLATPKGPEVITALNKLAQNVDGFSKPDQQKLLNGLAIEHIRHEDLQSANRLWSELVQQLPNNIELRLNLLRLAFQMANEEEITKEIKEIEKIEGSEGLMGGYWRVRYRVWQAQRESEKSQQAAKQAKDSHSEADRLSSLKTSEESQQRAQALQTEARLLINQLMSRRGDWSLIHQVLAQLEELELSQIGPDETQKQQKQEKQERIVNSYLRAIELGQRDSNTVSHVVELLFAAGRGNEALELYNRSSVEPQPGGDRVGRLAALQAYRNRDFRRAEELARRTMAANPGDFEVRLLLTRVLLDSGRQADAENELRQAVELSKNDPVRWITLVRVLAETKQPDKAEKAFKEAKANLAQLAEPTPSLAFAECCELVGRAYESVGSADAVKTWYGEAKSWLEKAQRAQPNNLSITRRLTQFLLQTKQSNEAESMLEAILKRGSSDNKTADEVAWARRELALTRIAKGDPEQARKALALFDGTDQTGATNQALEEAEDARALARVLDAQKTPEHRKRAIEIMNSLVGKNPKNSEDRLLLAQLYEVAGDWPEAREKYDELIRRSENQEDPATRIRRPAYFDQFIKSLIRHRQGNENQELTKAQELVDQLKRLQPDDLNPLVLEVMINRAQSEFEKNAALKLTQNPLEKEAALKRAQKYLEKATGLIQAFANRPNLTPAKLATLADQAERLNEIDLAEKLLRQILAKSPTPRVTMALAAFYGRQGRVKPALDLCAPLWPIAADLEVLAVVCLEVVLRPSNDPEPADLQRVISWLTQALNQARPSTTLMVFLANLLDRHEDYQEAEKLYRRALERGDPNWMSLNNLAWLLALQDGGNKKDALEYINRAIDLKNGPLLDFLDTRGIVYLAAGETQRAITDLEKAVAGNPSPPKYFHLAEAYLKANKVAEAKKNWRAANIKQLQKSGLHPLEQKTYNKVRSELGPP